MARTHSLLRRSAVAGTLVLIGALVTQGTALAGILADASATSTVQTAEWSAVPAAPGGTSMTTSFSTTYGEKATRYTLVDIVNDGSVPITGFTLSGTRSGSGNGSVESCAAGWTAPEKSKDAPLCAGAVSGSSVGSLVPGRGLSVAATIPAGGRLSLRIQSSNASWAMTVAVRV